MRQFSFFSIRDFTVLAVWKAQRVLDSAAMSIIIENQIGTDGDDVFLDSVSHAMDSIFMAHESVLPPHYSHDYVTMY